MIQKMDTYFHTKLCANVYKSFTCNNENGKQLRCPSVDKGLNKLWYIHSMELASSVKKNGLLIHTAK